MSKQLAEPKPDKNIACHLQEIAGGSLICQAAPRDSATPAICFDCSIGQVYREKGCIDVSGKIRVTKNDRGTTFRVQSMFCEAFNQKVSLAFCRLCLEGARH